MGKRAKILVVDDDRAVRTALQVNLSKAGLAVTLCSSPAEAQDALAEGTFDIVLTDVRMPGGTGIELLAHVKEHYADTAVVIMTGYGSVSDAVNAMKNGAADYIIKPVEKDELLLLLDRALENRALRAEVQQLRERVDEQYGFEKLIGRTPAMQDVYDQIAAVADSRATVLLEGPTGTGKELLAHAIHQRSGRRTGAFVRVNCAAIPESLLESELFGHEKGAFTGAIRQHLGKFEQADGGTLLLDEIGEINAYTQVKLLRILESGEFQRVGGSNTVTVDVRVIAATNRNLRQEAREGRFREDLYYRLNVVKVRVPALHDRADDIPLLVEHFIAKYAERNGRPAPTLSEAALQALKQYHWPGNVRQLEHLIERTIILNTSEHIQSIKLPDDQPVASTAAPATAGPPTLPPEGTTLQDALAAYERAVIIAALQEEDGVQARAARRLGLSRSNLNYRIQKLNIQRRSVDYE